MDVLPLVEQISGHGVLGIICAILLWSIYKKDQEKNAESAARIADAKAFTDLALKLKSEDVDAKKRIDALLDEFEKLDRAREGKGAS